MNVFVARIVLLAASGAALGADPSAVQRDIAYLASDALAGRASGMPGNAQAARYVAAAFAKAGLLPAGTARADDPSAPLDGSGYFQPFTFTAGVARGEGNSLAASGKDFSRTYQAGTEFEPAGISGSGKAAGEVLFAGYGIQSKDPARDDYAGASPAGRAVLLLSGHPGNDPHSPLAEFAGLHSKIQLARDLGATAVLITGTKDSPPPAINSDNGISGEGLPVFYLRRSVARQWLVAAGVSLEDVESKLFHEGSPLLLPVRVSLSADVEKVKKTTANVVGLLPGSDPVLKEEIVVIGAHFDHLGMGGPSSLEESGKPAIHHGADDNASGTAGVMALAEEFAHLRPRPRRGILFIAFTGEELGLLGSADYMKNPVRPLANTVAMINMDMVGRLRDGKVTVIGTGSSPRWNELLDHADRDEKLSLVRTESGFGASDQQSFYAAKIPVLFFFTGVHSDYHRASDTADKINAEGEVRVLHLVSACAREIADGDVRPEFHEVAGSSAATPTSFRVWFGSIPDYSAEVEGVKLSGVREDSPARKAGLLAGDVVVRFGGASVKNIEDYTAALARHRPGDSVEVVVQRGGKDLTFTAVLEAPRRKD